MVVWTTLIHYALGFFGRVQQQKFVLAWDDFKASTGIGLQTPTTEYVCVKRGVITSGGNCLIGCDEITEDYLAVGTAVGDRCFTECWYKLDDA